MARSKPSDSPFNSGAVWEAFWATFHSLIEDQAPAPPVFVCSQDGRKRLNPGTALRCASELYDMPVEEILGRRGEQYLTEPRALVVWGLRNLGAGWSFAAIGRVLGGRDQKSIQYLNRRAQAFIASSARFRGASEDFVTRFGKDIQP